MIKIKYKTYLFLLIILAVGNVASAQNKKSKSKKIEHASVSTAEQRKNTNNFIEAVKERLNGNLKAAETLLKDVIASDPAHDAAYYEYAKILLAFGAKNQAIAELQKAIALRQDNIWYQVLLAQTYDDIGRYANSEDIWKTISAQSPENLEYLYNYSLSLIFQEKFKDALSVYNKMEVLMGINEDVTNAKKNIWLYLNKVDNAAKEMEKLAQAYPFSAKYYIEIADMYIDRSMIDKAFGYMQKASEVEPNNPDINMGLYKYFTQSKKYDDAFKHLLRAFLSPDLSIDEKIKILLGNLGASSRDSLQIQKDYLLLDNLIKTHPDNPKSWSIYADFLLRDSRYTDARQALEKVIGFDNSKYRVWEQYLLILMDEKDWETAYKQGAEAVTLFANRSIPFLCYGTAAYQKGEYELAVTQLEEGIKFATTDNEMFRFNFFLAESYVPLEQFEKAYRCYETILIKFPQNAMVLRNYSCLLSQQAIRLKEAVAMAKKANEISPNQALFEDAYGWALFQSGDYANAKLWIEKALAHQEGMDNSDVLTHYSLILEKLGDAEAAKLYKSKAEATKENKSSTKD